MHPRYEIVMQYLELDRLIDQADLVITAEGRSLGRGSIGDRILAMNLGSHTTVSGTIGADGLIHADGGEGS